MRLPLGSGFGLVKCGPLRYSIPTSARQCVRDRHSLWRQAVRWGSWGRLGRPGLAGRASVARTRQDTISGERVGWRQCAANLNGDEDGTATT